MNKIIKKIFLFVFIFISITTISSNKINAMRLFKRNKPNLKQSRLKTSNEQTRESRENLLNQKRKINNFLNEISQIVEEEAEKFKHENENLIKNFLKTIKNNFNAKLKNILFRIQQLIATYPSNEQQIINQILNSFLQFPLEEKILYFIENNLKSFFQNTILLICEIEEAEEEIRQLKKIKKRFVKTIFDLKLKIQETKRNNTKEEIIINIINPLIKNIFEIITKIENQILLPRLNQILAKKYNKIEQFVIKTKISNLINSWKEFLASLLQENRKTIAEVISPIINQMQLIET